MGLHKEMGGARPSIADPDWPKWCPIPYNIMLSNKAGGRDGQGGYCCCLGAGWASSVGGKELPCASLFSIFFYQYYFPSLFYPTKSPLSQPTCFNFLFINFLIQSFLQEREVEWANSCAVLSCLILSRRAEGKEIQQECYWLLNKVNNIITILCSIWHQDDKCTGRAVTIFFIF